MKINKWILLVFFTLFHLFQTSSYAQVTLPKVFGDNMVLQRDINIPVWGNATPGSLIVATLGKVSIKANLITFIAWFTSGRDLALCIERMVTVIVICCPHAPGLAVPLVVARSAALSAKMVC